MKTPLDRIWLIHQSASSAPCYDGIETRTKKFITDKRTVTFGKVNVSPSSEFTHKLFYRIFDMVWSAHCEIFFHYLKKQRKHLHYIRSLLKNCLTVTCYMLKHWGLSYMVVFPFKCHFTQNMSHSVCEIKL